MDSALGRLAFRMAIGVALFAAGRWYLTHQLEQVEGELRKDGGATALQIADRAGPFDYAYTGPTFGGIAGVTGHGTSAQPVNNSRPRELDGRFMSAEGRAAAAGWGAGQTLSGFAPVIVERAR